MNEEVALILFTAGFIVGAFVMFILKEFIGFLKH